MRQMRAIGNNHTHLTHYPSLSNEHVSILGGDDRTHLQSKPNRVNSCAAFWLVSELVAGFFATSYVGQHWTQGQPELVEEVWSVFTLKPPDIDHWSSLDWIVFKSLLIVRDVSEMFAAWRIAND